MVIGSSSLSSAGVTSASLPEERNGSHSRERSNRFTCGEMRAVWAFSSGEKKIARDPECSTMYATSSALRRVLIGTSTPPASGTPKWARRSGSELTARKATRSPLRSPSRRSADARRRARARICCQLRRTSPSATARRVAYASPARSRKWMGVSSCRCTGASDTSSSARGPASPRPMRSNVNRQGRNLQSRHPSPEMPGIPGFGRA